MTFTHDTRLSLAAAVDLVNTGVEPDTLTSIDQLDEFFARHEYTGSRRRDRAEVEEVRTLRGPLRALLTSSRDDAVPLLNSMLAGAGAVPRLVRHGHHDWHIHAVGEDAPLATRIVVESAMAMIDVIRADEMSRLSVCADAGCEGIVLDLSRNRSRRFCSTACGNRNAVAAYRARHR